MNRCRQPGHYHIKNVLILNVALICVLFSCRKQKGEDWPTFRYDSARSGATAGKLTLPPSQTGVAGSGRGECEVPS